MWARSGAMFLTGEADGPPLPAPVGPALEAARALEVLRRTCGGRIGPEVDGPALLGERAAIFGYRRRGRISPSGSCRLLRAADGWLAVNLPRPDDLALLPAWLEGNVAGDPWKAIESALAGRRALDLARRARMLGLAVSCLGECGCPADARLPSARAPQLVRPRICVEATGPRASERERGERRRWCERGQGRPPLVVDLSALWAGPLCAHLLGLAGARVIKVESIGRPDGARMGPKRFYDLLNAGKQSVALDFSLARERSILARLLAAADIVVEASRPRALAQLGADARLLVASRPGIVWVSITGYGRSGAAAMWCAFGDDAAVAGGLVGETEQGPVFCADAIADPLTGIVAASAALLAWRSGRAVLLDVSMAAVAAHARRIGSGRFAPPQSVPARPRARTPKQPARALGADTEAVIRELESGRLGRA
ncbi:MAG: CoA transferase [Candidatus Dadabacteria bacterium]|nr:MAG: CoA transferase [Candidatus Dadabacteria bacterium]